MWIVRISTTEVPLDEAQLVEWAQNGRIAPEDAVRRAATDESWLRAADVPQIRDFLVQEPSSDIPVVGSLLQRLSLLRAYVRTRRAVLSGERLFDESSSTLHRRKLLSAITFNLTESALAAGPIVFLATVSNYLFGVHAAAAPDTTFDQILSFFLPLSAPFVTLALAGLGAWASFHESPSRARFGRAWKAFLYLDGAYGLLPQAFMVGGIVLAQRLTEEPALPDSAQTICGAIVALMLVFAVVRQSWVVVVTIPSRLFAVNGYSSEVLSLFRRRKANVYYGPWTKYGLSMRFLGPLVTVIYFKIVVGLAHWLAIVVEQLR